MDGTQRIDEAQIKDDEAQIKKFHNEVHQEADGIIKYFMIGYFVFGLFLSIFYSSWVFGIVIGGVSLGLYYLAQTLFPGKFIFRLIVSFLFWNFTLQFIVQMQGMYEMHFFYFVTLTILLFYEDWRVLLPAIIYAILTFLFLFYLQLSGSELNEYFKNVPPLSSKNAILHLGILTLYAGLCMLWANLQKNQTKDSGLRTLRMQEKLNLMSTNINFADGISQGNLSTKYNAEKADELGESLMNMRDSLVEAAEREAKEKFVNVGLATIGEILRNNSGNLSILCDKVIEKLVNYMKANQGGIFIINEDESANESYLELMACRAYERKKYLEKRLEMGQGLVGQSAIEKRTIYMLDIPENYMRITSGLGLASPNCLLIVPLKDNEQVVGVIEMASFEEFSTTDVEFLEKVGESIASTVISAKTNQTTKELLEQSRQMTEEMQAQEEEMRQNMEEMQATQEEMGRTQREFEEKEANLNALINNTSDSIITIDRKYNIVVMNDVVKERYRGTQYEGMQEGADALEMLGNVRDEWKGYYDRALAGEKLEFTLRSSVHNENTYREYLINPIKEKTGSIIGVSIFSRDVTDKKKLEVALREKSFVFESVINNSSDTYLAIDRSYKIMMANDVIVKRFRDQGIKLKAGDKILDKIKGEDRETWRSRCDRALGGESFDIEETREVNNRTLYLQVSYYPIKDENEEIIGASIISHDVSERKLAVLQVAKLTAELALTKRGE